MLLKYVLIDYFLVHLVLQNTSGFLRLCVNVACGWSSFTNRRTDSIHFIVFLNSDGHDDQLD